MDCFLPWFACSCHRNYADIVYILTYIYTLGVNMWLFMPFSPNILGCSMNLFSLARNFPLNLCPLIKSTTAVKQSGSLKSPDHSTVSWWCSVCFMLRNCYVNHRVPVLNIQSHEHNCYLPWHNFTRSSMLLEQVGVLTFMMFLPSVISLKKTPVHWIWNLVWDLFPLTRWWATFLYFMWSSQYTSLWSG